MISPHKILTVDIGNTATKASVFEGERLVQSVMSPGCSAEGVDALMLLHHVDGVAYCCVGTDSEGIGDCLAREAEVPVMRLSYATPLPISIEYDSPGTLGLDRIAGAVGVASSHRPVLLVDAGTAVTLDLVAGGSFRGGNISPGLRLRFRSLNRFTSRLPLVTPGGEVPRLGHDTVTAIRSGAVRGLVYEIAGVFGRVREDWPDARLVLTGGDAPLLGRMLGDEGLACSLMPSAVGVGLVRIFNFNNPETNYKE